MTDNHSIVQQPDVSPSAQALDPIVREIIKLNPTPETLEKILALRRDEQRYSAEQAFATALVALKAELPPWIARDVTVDFKAGAGRVQYTHTSLKQFKEVVDPLLTKHGFALTWEANTDEQAKVCVTVELSHRMGHKKKSTLKGASDMSGSKSPAQGIASTITLFERYGAMALLGLASADMKEPTGEDTETKTDATDTNKNQTALAYIIKQGKTKAQAEAFVQRDFENWTAADLDKLRAWIGKEKAVS